MNVADLRPLQLPLVQSVTEDEDDDSPTKYGYYEHEHEHEYEGVDKHVSSENMNHHHPYSDPHAALVDQVRSTSRDDNNNNNNREALAYLLRYETMVRQQEAEDMATIDHVRPCVDRLQALAGMNMNFQQTALPEDVWTQEISYAQLKTALERLEQSHLEQQQSQHVESVKTNSAAATCEFMTTDRQLVMVLRLLTKSVPAASSTDTDTDTDSGSSSTSSEEDQDNKDTNSTMTITWAEFLQCYKTCIVGMLTLQHLPASANSQVRARTRDRTLSMLSLFEPPTSFAASSTTNDNLLSLQQHAQAFDVRRPGADSLATAPSSSSSSSFFKNLNSKKKRRAIITAAAVIGIIMAGVAASTTYSSSSSSSSPFTVDPAVTKDNGVENALTGVPADSILQASPSFTSNNGKETSMVVQQQQQRQQSLPSTFFSRAPLVVEKRGAVPVRQVVASTTAAAAAPFMTPQEFMTFSSPHPTTESMTSIAPAMIGGVVGCVGAPLLVAGLQGILKQATVTATAIGGSVSAGAGSTGLLIPVLAGMGALLAVTSVVRGIWSVLHSLVGAVAGRH